MKRFGPRKMVTAMEFDQEEVRKFVALCDEEGEMKRNNATEEALTEIRDRINRQLVRVIVSQTLFNILQPSPVEQPSVSIDEDVQPLTDD